jgi:hypothetical protein
MIIMKLKVASIVSLMTLSALLYALPINIAAQETPAAKTARLLRESKMGFTKVDEAIWTLPFDGKKLKNYKVIVTADKTYLLMFVMVANQKEFRATPELLKTLLLYNDQFDKVKIGIDKDGFLCVRVDLSVRLVDRQEFIDSLNQTAAAADEVYGSITPYLISAK